MEYLQKLEEGKALVEKLLSGKQYRFAELKPSDIQDKLSGIYAIFNSSGETLYIGRTKNLRQRLYNNHLMGPLSNARLKKYLVEDDKLSHISNRDEAKSYIKENCFVQYIVEGSVVRRGQIEGLLSFALNVKYMHEEH
ncbi:MAG: GIY-YIG nuclease family protein [Oscillospiraceae bacterium]|jgi:predicted GIY-YIG superfamily endonuclease|nr:GIY-YIG nuclease family protein [Oscillospiraceae bacterium]